MPAKPRTLAIDVGGTGIKTIVLDPAGKAVTERLRVDTPRPATPRAVVGAIVAMAGRQGAFERVSVGFPGVVRRGVTESAWNLHPTWNGVDLASTLEKALGRPVRAANDADVQGLGVIRGHGVELVITLGTGFGSSLFVSGHLVPNVQLAHHAAWRAKTYEEELGAKALEKTGKKKWNRRLAKAVATLESLFNFDRLYIGGGNARKVTLERSPKVRIVSNVAGLLGGIALWRSEREHAHGEQ
ncbi:MAG TPA: ROK family protein [Thermoanaerobaculia bacterium]|nr:ROK family protein [Thermoanaerobaculia bacterium]